jgi:hypothetical protein
MGIGQERIRFGSPEEAAPGSTSRNPEAGNRFAASRESENAAEA